MRRYGKFALVLVAVLVLAQIQAIAVTPDDKVLPLKVMTRNVYQGTDFQEVMSSTSFADFLHQVTVTINNVRATKPELRMAAIAFEIAEQQPDIVALQEVTVWRTGTSPYELKTEIDPLEMIVSDLKRLGSPYKVVNVVSEFDFTAPSDTGLWVSTTTKNAIIVRESTKDLVVSNPQTGLFPVEHSLSLPLPGIPDPVVVYRGWASIDVQMKGREFRFITAHPEAFVWQYEYLQVLDVLSGPAATSLPVIMAADFNMQAANPDDPTYQYTYMTVTQQAGFTDAWAALGRNPPAYTCCQLNSLLNPTSLFDQRIDLIFVRGPFQTKQIVVTGESQAVRDLLGVWPSDHGGVASHLKMFSGF